MVVSVIHVNFFLIDELSTVGLVLIFLMARDVLFDPIYVFSSVLRELLVFSINCFGLQLV